MSPPGVGKSHIGCGIGHALINTGYRVLYTRTSELVQRLRRRVVWLSTEPMDMRAGTDTALARVVKVFGAARPHHAYVFANRRSTRLKVLVHDGIGIWLAARRLHEGRFIWPGGGSRRAAIDHARAARCAGARPALAAHR